MHVHAFSHILFIFPAINLHLVRGFFMAIATLVSRRPRSCGRRDVHQHWFVPPEVYLAALREPGNVNHGEILRYDRPFIII